MAAPLLPEARLEPTLLVALIAFTYDRLAYDRPLTPAERPLHPSPPLGQEAGPVAVPTWAPRLGLQAVCLVLAAICKMGQEGGGTGPHHLRETNFSPCPSLLCSVHDSDGSRQVP